MVYFRITDDLFIQLNRERTLLRISIFQYDYLRYVHPSLLGKILVSGSPSQLREEIDHTETILLTRTDEKNNKMTNSFMKYIE